MSTSGLGSPRTAAKHEAAASQRLAFADAMPKAPYRKETGIFTRRVGAGTSARNYQHTTGCVFSGVSATLEEMAARFRCDWDEYEALLNKASEASGFKGHFSQGPIFSVYRMGTYAASFSQSGKMGLHPMGDGESLQTAAFDLEPIQKHNAFLQEKSAHERFRDLALDAAILTLADQNESFRRLYQSDPQRAVQEYSNAIMGIFKQSNYVRTSANRQGTFSI